MVERFGEFRNDRDWSKDSFTVAGRTRNYREPTITVMSNESFKASGHYDFGGTDDAEDQDSTNTPELIAKTRRIDSLMYPMISEGERKRLTFGTFWDDNDLYNYKMRLFKLHGTRKDGKGEEIVRQRFVRKDVTVDLDDGTKATNRVFQFWKPCRNDDGSPLSPLRLPLPRLAVLKASMMPSEYAAQYDLDPIATEDAKFRKEMFRYDDRIPSGPLEWYVLGDFAHSLRPDSDYTGFVVVAVDDAYCWYVVEAGRFRFDPAGDGLLERIAFYHRAYPSAQMCFEEDAYAAGIKRRLEEKLLAEHLTPRIEWIKSGGRKAKTARVFATAGQFGARQVVFLPGTHALAEELLRWPKSRTKDVADAFANLLEVAQSASPHLALDEEEEAQHDPRDDDPAAPWHHAGLDENAKRWANVSPEEVPWEVL